MGEAEVESVQRVVISGQTWGNSSKNSQSEKIFKNAAPLDTDIIQNRILPIWMRTREKQGGNKLKIGKIPLKVAKNAKY
jgi:hypothetical protein